MKSENFLFRKAMIIVLLLLLAAAAFAACSEGGQNTVSPGNSASETPSARPEKQPANNEKPELVTADNKYASVAIYDKFGAWPEKKGDLYYNSQVGTWYTLWWNGEGETFYYRWYREDWARLKPVDYGYYSSGDSDYLTSVLARMKYIGIDFLLLDDTNGEAADIAANMARVFRAAKLMNGYTPKVAIATGGAIRDNNDAAKQQDDYDRYYKLYQRFPDVFYEFLGKPFLVIYVAEKADIRFDDSGDRFTLRYGTGYISWQNRASDQTVYKTQGNFGWVFDVQNEGTEVMGAQPGYNKLNGGAIPREGGKHYIQQWLEAIKADPTIIMVPSYNDHAEETGWEATEPIRPSASSVAKDTPGEDPYLYEKITEAYLALRYGYIEGFFYQTEGTEQVYRCVNGYLEKVDASAAGGEPVILIPEGYIEWELARSRG